MNKIYMKDIKKICSCISGLSCQTIRSNEKGVFNRGYIYTYTIYPYGNCITFQFIENDHITFNSYSKKFMFDQLLRYYKKGLNSWIELYNNDRFKTKREKKRMNYYINKLNDRIYNLGMKTRMDYLYPRCYSLLKSEDDEIEDLRGYK